MSADRAATDPTAALPPAGAPPTLPPASGPPTADRVAVPGYEILAELGRGGMGVVYKARQAGLNRDVALKMVLSGGHASATDLARFKAEAEAVAKLQHPNVVQIYEVGEAGGLPYFSLEYCPGGSLEKLLAGIPQSPRDAAALIETLARAIHAAHQAGIVHRDLKPANVLLSGVRRQESGVSGHESASLTPDACFLTPKISDFGLAKQIDSASGRTASGAILGTPSYMAPEQANGSKEIGPAVDTYALGAILYELLTGRPPFRAATPLDTVLQVVGSDPVPPTRLNPQVPRDLETIALKCLQKEPAKRYSSAAALAEDLHRWQAGEPIAARPAGTIEKATKWAKRRPAVAALSGAVVLALAGGFSGVLYELRIANDARAIAEAQEGLANQRADDLAKEQVRVRRELHRSDLLRADLLLQGNEPARAEQLLWRSHFTRPDNDDRRAYWRLWELYHQRPRRAGTWIGGAPYVRSLSPDGRRLAVVRGSRITIHDAASGAVQTEFTTSQTTVGSMSFSRDGRRLGLLSMADAAVAVWDLDPAPTLRATLHPYASARVNPSLVIGAAMVGLSPEQRRQAERTLEFAAVRICFLDGDRVLITYADHAILWNLEGPTVLARLDLESAGMLGDPFWSAAILPDAPMGDTIPVVRAGTVQLWDLPRTAGMPIDRTQLDFSEPAGFRRGPPVAPKSNFFILSGSRGDWVSAAAFSPDRKWLITEKDRLAQVWDFATGRKCGEAQLGPPTYGARIAVTPDCAAVRSIDSGGIRLWRLPALEPVRTIPRLGASGFVQFAGFSPDGRRTCVAEDNIIAAYDHQPATAVRPLLPTDRSKREMRNSDLAATGPVVTLDPAARGITAWSDGRAGRITIPWGLFQLFETRCAISPSGAIAVSFRDSAIGGTVTVYDLTKRRVVGSIGLSDPEKGVARFPGAIGFTPDGRTAAIGTEHGLLIADVGSAKIVRVLRIVTNAGFGIEFTPDGRGAAYRDPKEFVLLDFATGRELARVAAGGAEQPIGFAPDGSLFATRDERKLILRNADTLVPVGEIPADVTDLGAGAFAPDSGTIATGGQDGKLRLWDVRRREELVTVDLGAGPIHKVVFTPDGNRLRFIADKQIGEFELHAFDPYVEGNLTWNLLRLLPELDRSEAERALERLRDTHPGAYQAGLSAMPTPR
jgi:WD40 repeat protein/tRNA A-37 threonylcarbamoyl transferase component Bud32